jgi:hypothetical protein
LGPAKEILAMKSCERTVVIQVARATAVFRKNSVHPIRYRCVLCFIHWGLCNTGVIVTKTKKVSPTSIYTLFQTKVPRKSDLFALGYIPVTDDPEMIFVFVGKIRVQLSVRLAASAYIPGK